MATAKKVLKASPAKKIAKATTTTAKATTAKAVGVVKPIKTAFNKSTLATHLAEQSGVEPKAAKAVLAALESTMLASLHKKGLGEFTLPGLLKVSASSVPAKKKRFGKDPFTGEERWFNPKPATVKVKVRALKKVKDAAL